jgi:hypothetical protein
MKEQWVTIIKCGASDREIIMRWGSSGFYFLRIYFEPGESDQQAKHTLSQYYSAGITVLLC